MRTNSLLAVFAILLFLSVGGAGATCGSYSYLQDSTYFNEQRDMTWGDYYDMQGYVARYRNSGQTSELVTAVDYFDEVFCVRDDVRGVYGSRKVWSARVDTDGTWLSDTSKAHALSLDTGNIILPIAEFVYLIYNAPTSVQNVTANNSYTLLENAEIYKDKIVESIAEHDADWNEQMRFYRAPYATQGYLNDSGASWRPLSTYGRLPFNMGLTMGGALIYMYGVTQTKSYLYKAQDMARLLKSFLTLQGSSYYSWPYWTRDPNDLSDISHEGMTLDFVRLAYEAGIEFTNTDMTRFANAFAGPQYFTYSEMLGCSLSDNEGIAYYLDASCGSVNDDNRAAAFWLYLNRFNSSIRAQVVSVYYNDYDGLTQGSSSSAALGRDVIDIYSASQDPNDTLSKLAYSSSCTRDAQCDSNICYGGSVCGNLLGSGSTCTRDRECSSGLCLSGTCATAQAKSYGSSCTRDNECASDICFQATVCGNPLGTSSTCNRNHECSSNICVSGTCRASGTLSNGSSCKQDAQCASGVCYADVVCGAKLGNGSTCYRDVECTSGKCNLNKQCASNY